MSAETVLEQILAELRALSRAVRAVQALPMEVDATPRQAPTRPAATTAAKPARRDTASGTP